MPETKDDEIGKLKNVPLAEMEDNSNHLFIGTRERKHL
jgi:hypothetical protein